MKKAIAICALVAAEICAADPAKSGRPATQACDDGIRHSREHEPAWGVGELLGSYETAGRIAGVVSVLSDWHAACDCAQGTPPTVFGN